MGRDWYWAGRSSKRGGGAASAAEEAQTTPSGCMCAVFQFFDFHPFHFPTINQQQQSTFKKPPSCIPEDITTVPKGAEAPRNSLESEDGTASSVIKEEEEHFKIPKNIQIKTCRGCTRASAGNLNDLSSESPGAAKTPTLVARLMGLDLLPGSNSPSSSSSSCLSTPNPQGNVPNRHHMKPRQHIQTKHRNSTDGVDIASTRSLPETPRISSARRSDVDYHHRLSLQINKENNIGEDLELLPRFSFSKRKCDENNNGSSKSSSHLARQIVKQVKESVVSRKVGQDITNTLKIREQAREELVSQFKFKKPPKATLKALDESSPGKHSPRLRFTDTKHNKPNTTTTTTTTPSPLTPKEQNTHLPPPSIVNVQPQLPRVVTRPKPQALVEQQELQNQKSISVTKCKKVNNEKFSSRLKRPPQTTDIIRNKQEEPFIVRPTSPTTRASDIKNATKSKKTHPLSSNLLSNINTVPNLFPIKTDPSPPATKINQKQSQVCDTQEPKGSSQQLSSCSSQQRYEQEEMRSTLATRETSIINDNIQDKINDAASTAGEGAEQHHRPEFQYITGILSRTTNKEGATATTSTVSLSQWFSPTHPLDPSIFHHLEEQPISNSHVSSPNNIKDRIFSTKNQLGHRWNRRLMFDLVDEVLMEILRPKNNEKRLWFLHGCCCCQGSIEGLMEKMWKRIAKFPCKRCEFLEDIDGLIEEEDMEKVNVEGEEGLEEAGEGLAAEIEGNIWDTLVHESVMVMMVMGGCGSGKWGP